MGSGCGESITDSLAVQSGAGCRCRPNYRQTCVASRISDRRCVSIACGFAFAFAVAFKATIASGGPGAISEVIPSARSAAGAQAITAAAVPRCGYLRCAG